VKIKYSKGRVPHWNKLFFKITGVMASEKSTIAELLASKMGKSGHLRNDVFLRMIVSGCENMSVQPSKEKISYFPKMYYRLEKRLLHI